MDHVLIPVDIIETICKARIANWFNLVQLCKSVYARLRPLRCAAKWHLMSIVVKVTDSATLTTQRHNAITPVGNGLIPVRTRRHKVNVTVHWSYRGFKKTYYMKDHGDHWAIDTMITYYPMAADGVTLYKITQIRNGALHYIMWYRSHVLLGNYMTNTPRGVVNISKYFMYIRNAGQYNVISRYCTKLELQQNLIEGGFAAQWLETMP
ncbi:hypothetical protein F-S17_0007 [Faustovirus]|nr:hypothetical protein F-S17_0007 [Faustovirus]